MCFYVSSDKGLALIKAIFLGITQGLTEFFPVSSSGHLFVLQNLFQRLGFSNQEGLLSFFVFLHAATLFAVFVFLAKKIPLLFKKQLFFHLVIITVVTGIIGLLIRFLFAQYFTKNYLLAFCFLVNSVILLSLRKYPERKTWKELSFKDSLIIGLLQGISFFPGISRSGITITGLVKRGVKKEDAFTLSFLAAIPVISGAFLLEAQNLFRGNIAKSTIIIGFIFAFFTGLVALKFLKKILIMEKFRSFAYYCLFISLLSLFV